jgi:hypothetical protein
MVGDDRATERGAAGDPSRRPTYPAPTPTGGDLTHAVTEMKRLLDQIEHSSDRGDPHAAQATARILQYVHDSHQRIVETLENKDRSELMLQSTQALNQTFRKLHQAQDALVDKLLVERRRQPLWIVLGALVTAALVALAVTLWLDHRNARLGLEVDRMATARDQLTGAMADSSRAFHEMGGQLAATVDKVIAANRVLDNESRSRAAELERLRAELDATKREREAAAQAEAERKERLERLERHNRELTHETDALRQRLVAEEFDRTRKLEALFAGEAKPPANSAPTATTGATPPASRDSQGAEPVSSEEAPPEAFDAPAEIDAGIDAGIAAEIADIAAVPALPTDVPDEGAAAPLPSAAFDPLTRAVNDFFAAAGIIDHRLLRHGGAEGGVLRDVLLELREPGTPPIGHRSAATMTLEIDPAALSGAILLEGGESVERRVRTPFPKEGLRLAIPAIAPGTFTDPELLPFVRLTAAAPEAPPAAPAPRFDPIEPLERLNAALAGEGRKHLRFTALGGIDGGRLMDVVLSHYSGSGALLKTVHARACTLEIDPVAARVGLVFRDGHHVADGREVPFYAPLAAGRDVASWRLDLVDVDVERWIGLKERLANERFER